MREASTGLRRRALSPSALANRRAHRLKTDQSEDAELGGGCGWWIILGRGAQVPDCSVSALKASRVRLRRNPGSWPDRFRPLWTRSGTRSEAIQAAEDRTELCRIWNVRGEVAEDLTRSGLCPPSPSSGLPPPALRPNSVCSHCLQLRGQILKLALFLTWLLA